MPHTLRIDLVSDISCPWCAIGLYSLLQAMQQLEGEIAVDLRFQPFELNPDMAAEGEDRVTHLQARYGADMQKLQASWTQIQARGSALGLNMGAFEGRRIYNSFDAHRLLHWAADQGPGLQLALKQQLLQANFTDNRNIADHQVLADAAVAAGLDRAQALAVLASDAGADAVRQAEGFYQRAGIQSVPAFVINQRHLISGGQPSEVLVQALRSIAAESPAAAASHPAQTQR